jgi:ribonuclease HI
MENSTNAFHKTCNDNNNVCTIVGNVPKKSVLFATPLLAKVKRHSCQKQHATCNTIHFYKVKAHAGFLGNERSNAIAQCSAKNKCGYDIYIVTLTPIPTHPFSGQ